MLGFWIVSGIRRCMISLWSVCMWLATNGGSGSNLVVIAAIVLDCFLVGYALDYNSLGENRWWARGSRYESTEVAKKRASLRGGIFGFLMGAFAFLVGQGVILEVNSQQNAGAWACIAIALAFCTLISLRGLEVEVPDQEGPPSDDAVWIPVEAGLVGLLPRRLRNEIVSLFFACGVAIVPLCVFLLSNNREDSAGPSASFAVSVLSVSIAGLLFIPFARSFLASYRN